MAAVSAMTSLEDLDWGIMMDKGSGDDNNKDAECIPLLPEGGVAPAADGEHVHLMPEYVGISQLMQRLTDSLPHTKIRVFRVPVINTTKK